MNIHPQELSRQAQAAKLLLESLKPTIGDDDDFAMDAVEGQTDFVEIVNILVGKQGEDEAHRAALADYAKKIIARMSRVEARIEKRRDALQAAFETAGIKGSLRCAFGTVGLRRTPPSVVILDKGMIPDAFWSPGDPKLDRRGVADALKAGRDVPGACLSNGGVTLSIRTA